MQSIHTWADLSRFGIFPLTGEACGLMYRILCDVTEQGRKTLEKAFGVVELRLSENWNQGTEAEPHVGSILLAREVLPFVGVFVLLEAGCTEAWLTNGGGVIGIEPSDSDEEVECFKRYHARHLIRRLAYNGTAGDRNVHLMSGRIR